MPEALQTRAHRSNVPGSPPRALHQPSLQLGPVPTLCPRPRPAPGCWAAACRGCSRCRRRVSQGQGGPLGARPLGPSATSGSRTRSGQGLGTPCAPLQPEVSRGPLTRGVPSPAITPHLYHHSPHKPGSLTLTVTAPAGSLHLPGPLTFSHLTSGVPLPAVPSPSRSPHPRGHLTREITSPAGPSCSLTLLPSPARTILSPAQSRTPAHLLRRRRRGPLRLGGGPRFQGAVSRAGAPRTAGRSRQISDGQPSAESWGPRVAAMGRGRGAPPPWLGGGRSATLTSRQSPQRLAFPVPALGPRPLGHAHSEAPSSVQNHAFPTTTPLPAFPTGHEIAP